MAQSWLGRTARGLAFVAIFTAGGAFSAYAQGAHEIESFDSQVIQLTVKKEYSEAIAVAEKVLKIKERVFGKEHFETLRHINTLAALYYHQDRYDEAVPLYKRVLEGYERELGKEHSGTLMAAYFLAHIYVRQGRDGEAVVCSLPGFRIIGDANNLGIV
jgi:tetratricopeptide (TPR) repeat protein